jgi:DNA replication and repair protein RecF
MITYARLQHFRSFTDGSFDFEPGVNIVVGPNASGKTTILEAVTLSLRGKSFKARDYELIQTDADWARVDIGGEADERTTKLIKETDTKVQKSFDVAGQGYKRLSVSKMIPFVLFEPNHLLLLHGSPELRRTFLDDLIGSLLPQYESTRRHYKRVLAQRNALLKEQSQLQTDQLFVWNLRLSELGGKIAFERQALLSRFNTVISELYSSISGHQSAVELGYDTPLAAQNYETSLLHALERSVGRDQQLGFTSYGPHREDMVVYLNGRLASESASRGEVRTLVLVLKMLEAQFIEEARSVRPLLLLDDVFSELDGRRRQSLVRFLKPYQSLITTTDADVVIDHFTHKAHVIAL